ncbi:unnamed protein product [marine sediment metagenome]|uniref:Uncharacterized protein n=1 Tax=marine sediment metagenome TaxID=412755 RepID=X1R7E5_9ZZZZ
MFWKKKPAAGEPKAKEPSPKEVITQIEQLTLGQALSYRLLETYGGGLAVIELNPQYPKKGRKYILSLEELVDGKPAGKRHRLWDSDKPKDLAGWILDQNGELL